MEWWDYLPNCPYEDRRSKPTQEDIDTINEERWEARRDDGR